jgi:hypothetical protein
MKIIDWIVEQWQEFYYKRSFKENIIYISSDGNIAIMYSKDKNKIQVFTHGLVYHLPIKIPSNNKEYDEAVSSSFENSLDSLSISTLEIMLKEYEYSEDYEKCIKIKNTITSKLQSNDN